MFYDSCLI